MPDVVCNAGLRVCQSQRQFQVLVDRNSKKRKYSSFLFLEHTYGAGDSSENCPSSALLSLRPSLQCPPEIFGFAGLPVLDALNRIDNRFVQEKVQVRIAGGVHFATFSIDGGRRNANDICDQWADGKFVLLSDHDENGHRHPACTLKRSTLAPTFTEEAGRSGSQTGFSEEPTFWKKMLDWDCT